MGTIPSFGDFGSVCINYIVLFYVVGPVTPAVQWTWSRHAAEVIRNTQASSEIQTRSNILPDAQLFRKVHVTLAYMHHTWPHNRLPRLSCFYDCGPKL